MSEEMSKEDLMRTLDKAIEHGDVNIVVKMLLIYCRDYIRKH